MKYDQLFKLNNLLLDREERFKVERRKEKGIVYIV